MSLWPKRATRLKPSGLASRVFPVPVAIRAQHLRRPGANPSKQDTPQTLQKAKCRRRIGQTERNGSPFIENPESVNLQKTQEADMAKGKKKGMNTQTGKYCGGK
ncbi:hypothetical protein FAMCQIZV_CDS0026 [Phage C72C1]|nr:hypothetical protein FAMCQIZV_CDS0026 [Phage C72C1]